MSTDIIKGVNIVEMCSARDKSVAAYIEAHEKITEAQDHLYAFMTPSKHGYYYSVPSVEFNRNQSQNTTLGAKHPANPVHEQRVRENIRKAVDACFWREAFERTQMMPLLSAKRREELDKQLGDGSMPEFTIENVISTLGSLKGSAFDILLESIEEVYRRLSWDHKTNNPSKLTEKLIMKGVVSTYLFGVESHTANIFRDLFRILYTLDGQPAPDADAGYRFFNVPDTDRHGREVSRMVRPGETAENDYIAVKLFGNGNGHVRFKRLDLLQKMNELLGQKYPHALGR